MGQRIISLLLAFVLVLGMVPANALGVFAAETNQVTVDYEAAYASRIYANGVLSEGNWLGGAKLSGGQAFDILWDGDNLYFGVVPGAEDAELIVKIGNKTVAKAAKTNPAVWNTGVEVQVPYVTKGVAVLENVTLIMGTSTWTGNVGLVAKESTTIKAHEFDTATAGMTATAGGNGIHAYMPAATTAPGANEYYQRHYTHNAAQMPILSDREGAMRIEFTFTATDMPVVSNGHIGAVGVVVPTYAGYGHTITMNQDGIVGGIVNTADGLYYNHTYIYMLDGAAKYSVTRTKLDKQEGDTFRFSLDLKADGSMDIYVDDALKGTVATAISSLEAMTKAGVGTSATYVVNTYRYGYNGKTTDGFYRYEDIAYTVEDLLITKDVAPDYADLTAQTDGKLNAFFTGERLKAESASWAYADCERFADGIGKAFALIQNNKIYVMVKAPNAASVTATLGSETETATAVNGTALLCFGDTMIMELGQEVAFQATVTDVAGGTAKLWENPGKLVVTGKRVTASVYDRIAFDMDAGVFAGSSTKTDAAWSFTASHTMTKNGDSVAAVLNNATNAAQSAIDFSKIILLEQELDVDSMPWCATSGKWENPYTAYGLTIMLESGAGQLWAAAVSPDEAGNLYLTFYQADKKISRRIALGRQVGGDPFTLSLLWNSEDSSATVFVDGVKAGTVFDSTKFSGQVYKQNTLLYKYYDKSMDGTKTAAMEVSNARITTVTPGAALETITSLEGMDGFVAYARFNGGTPQWHTAQAVNAQWDNTNLYLSVKPSDPNGDLTVKLGEKTKTVNAGSAEVTVSGSYWNVTIPLADLGIALSDYNTAVTMTLSGAFAWRGTLVFVSETRNALATATPAITNADEENAVNKSSVTNGVYRFAIEYKEAKVDNTFDRVYSHKGGVAEIDAAKANLLDDIHVLEFDFRADAMPEFTGVLSGGQYVCQGFTMGVQWEASKNTYGYNAGITNIKDKGLVFVVQKDVVTNDVTGAELIELDKEVGDTFHIRLEYEPAVKELKVYCDGQLKGSINAQQGLSFVSWGGTAKLVMLNLYSSGSNVARPAGIPIDFTISNLTSGTLDNDSYVLSEEDLSNLTFNTIKGENEKENKVLTDLVLPATLNHPIFNGLGLTWTSSNESYIGADGSVNAGAENSTAVLTATITGTEISKEFRLSSAGDTLAAVAVANTIPVEKMAIDGVLNEVSWSEPHKLIASNANVDGILYTTWGMGKLYLAAQYTGADRVTVKLGEKSWTLDLAAAMESADGLVIGVAKNGVLELCVDLIGCGMAPSAYYDAVAFNFTLSNGTDTAVAIAEDSLKLIFTDREPGRFGLGAMTNAKTNAQEGAVNSNKIHLVTTDANRRYLQLGASKINHAYDIYFEQTLTVAKMEATGALNDGASSGYCFWIVDGTQKPAGFTGTIGNVAQGNLWNNNGVLTLRVNCKADFSKYVDVALGVGLNETFTLGFMWKTDDSVEVYVNGDLKGTVKQVTFNKMYLGSDCFMLNAACVVDITIEDVIYTVAWDSATPSFTLEDVIAGCNLSRLTSDLPTTVTKGHFTCAIDWNSSNTDAITDDGKVTRSENQAVTVTLNPTVNGKAMGTVTATIPSTATNAYFTTQPVTPDGNLTERDWNHAEWKPFMDNSAEARIAALIHKGILYFAVEYGTAESVTITLGSKTFTVSCTENTEETGIISNVNTAAGTLEIEVNLKALGMAMTDYGAEFAYQAELSDGTKLEATATKLIVPALQINPDGIPVSFDGRHSDRGAVITGNSFVITAANSYDGRTASYILQNKFDVLDFTSDMLMEQTIDIVNMPWGNRTGSFLGNYEGYGYLVSMYDSGGDDMITYMLYRDEAGNLYVGVRQLGGKSASVALGLTVDSDPFTLGTLITTDGAVEILVNGVSKGKVENANLKTLIVTTDPYGYRNVLVIKLEDDAYRDAVTAEVRVTDMKLTVMNGQYPLVEIPALLEELTEENILKGLNITGLTESDVFPTVYNAAFLGELDLEWFSSDDSVITVVDGKVTAIHQKDYDTSTVTVTAYFNGNKLFAKEVIVANRYEVFDSLLAQNPVVIDGKLTEPDWASWNGYAFENASAGMASLWSKGYVYFAVNAQGADTLILELGNNALTFDLAEVTCNAENVQVAKNGNVVEIAIPMDLCGIAPTDYNQAFHFHSRLVSDEELVLVEDGHIRISGIVAEVETMGSYTKAGFTTSSNAVSFKGEENGSVNYAFENGNPIDHSLPVLISQDMLFNALPASDGKYSSALQANGFYGWIADSGVITGGGTGGNLVFHSVYRPNADTNELVLRIRTASSYVDYSLGEKLGVTFRLSYIWNPDNSVIVFVDGQYLGTVENAGYYASGCGSDIITYRYYAKASANMVDLTVSNVTMVQMKYRNALEELTPAAIFGRIDLGHVRKNLPMVSSFSTANFASIGLTWVVEDETLVSKEGVINRHATEARSTKITLYVGTQKLWSVDVTLDPMSATDMPAPGIINTGFTADDVTLDGTIADHGWTMNGWVLDGMQQICGSFGAQWDQYNLYLAIDFGAAEAVSFVLGDPENNRTTFILDTQNEMLKIGDTAVEGAQVAISGTVAEIKLPLKTFLGVEKLSIYDVMAGFQLSMDFGGTVYKYNGALKLTSVDWWLTENAEHAMPVPESMYKSVAYKGGGPDGNQGAARTENGWRLYDLYNENGENPAGVRTYVLFMKQDVYEDFDDRRQGVHVEFDFLADSMPVWKAEECVDFAAAFACYGFTISLADKANASKYSNVVVCGIMNTEDGLVLAVKRTSTQIIPLNKQVGDQFRIGMSWLPNSDVIITIDGEHFTTVSQMSSWVGSVGDCSFVMNMIRNNEKPESAADNMEVFISNLAFGKRYSQDNILDRLTVEDLLNENDTAYHVVSDLTLPTTITNGQLDAQYQVTWTSDNAAIAADGKVTRPTSGGVMVTLTATLENGESKTYQVIVVGEEVGNDGILIVTNDTNPGGTAGTETNEILYTLDATNNSVIRDQGDRKEFNLVTLTDIDSVARLNRESLTLWISDDNVTYTEVRNFKLTHDGVHWYLYDIRTDDGQAVSARYVKVHYNHFDNEDFDFVAVLSTMIQVSTDETLIQPENAAEVEVVNNGDKDWLDEAVMVTLPEGITVRGLRIVADSELLYYYAVDENTVVVRIADLAAGEAMDLHLWNAADGISLENKEAVYEVTYGTRETYRNNGGRWVLNLKAGMKFPGADGKIGTSDDLVQEKDAILSMNGGGARISYDNGYTWTTYASFAFEDPKYPGNHDWILDEGETKLNLNGCGGYIVDWTTGRIMYETHILAAENYFVAGDKSQSDCRTGIIGSDDGGKTWRVMDILDQNFDENSTYVLSYSDGVQLKTYDGDGPNVDFVFNMGAQYNNNGAFCGRVAYTTDAGESWQFSVSCITFGNEYAFEGGVSECTILEREDGTLVLYGRCQSTFVDQFAISYSLDHGITWLTPAEASSIYTVNTQPVMIVYTLEDGNKLPLMTWGGNNIRGGDSYIRNPFNIALSLNGMDTFRNIQNTFSKTFMEGYTSAESHYITNASMQQMNGDDLIVTFSRLQAGDSVTMMVKDFSDWFLRTKGAYDSFEHGTAKYEGWTTVSGSIYPTQDQASAGNWSMEVAGNTNVTRSVPYLQDGKVSIDIFATEASNFTLELQSAYSLIYGDMATPIGMQVNDNVLTFLGSEKATGLTLKQGWNTLTFDLNLSDATPTATLSLNGGEAVALPVNETAGDYVCYITIGALDAIYVDELLVTSSLATAYQVTEADQAAADAVIALIKAIGEVTAEDAEAIQAARAAYDALTQVQRDLINRRVRISNEDVAMAPGTDITEYMVNYHDVLVAAEVANLPGFSGFLILNETIDLNLVIPEVAVGEGNEISVKYADGSDAPYTIVNTDNGSAIQYRSFSNQMTREITVQVFDGNGVPLTKPLTISVRGYVQKLLPVCQNDVEKALMIRMLDYGALAQLYTDPNTTDLANSIIDETLRTFINNYDLVKPDAYTSESATTAGVFSANLSLRESVVMNIQIAQDAVGENENLVVKLDGKELTANQYQKTIDNDGKITISYKFHSDKMNQELYVAIVDASGAVRNETSLSIRDYAHKCMDACEATNRTLCAMLVAMLDYGALAQQYAGTATDDLANRYVSAEQRAWLTGYIWPEN